MSRLPQPMMVLGQEYGDNGNLALSDVRRHARGGVGEQRLQASATTHGQSKDRR